MMKTECSKRIGEYIWLTAFWATMALMSGLIYLYVIDPPKPHSWQFSLTDGFNGGIVAGILTGFLFLFLTMHLNVKSEKNLELSATILKGIERQNEVQRKIRRFESFVQKENYSDVGFPDIPGFFCTIEPCRDLTTNEPVCLKTEMSLYYVIKTRSRQSSSLMSDKTKEAFEKSPIKENEFYFCRFTDDWYMSPDTNGDVWYRFYFSGKTAMAHYQSANSFMGHDKPQVDLELVIKDQVAESGKPWKAHGDGIINVAIYKDKTSDLFFKINDSPPKKLYLTNNKGSVPNEDYHLKIEDLGGYGDPEFYSNICTTIDDKLKAQGISIAKVPWYNIRNS